MSETDGFEALAALLPFYVNGSLSPVQHARITAALERMPELRAELVEVEAIAALVKDGGAAWLGTDTTAPADRLDKVMSRIAQEPSRTAAGSDRLTTVPSTETNVRSLPLRQRLFQPPYSMALAAGLAAVALTQGGLLFTRQAQTDDAYGSLSGPGQAHSTGLFTLRLKQSAPWGDVLAFLDSQGLSIVAGPQDGMIDVAPNGSLHASQIDALEQTLRRSPLVVFVGRGS